MPAEAGTSHPRAFITCASRARPSLAPLLDVVEARLHDLGWRTRLPRRAPPRGGLATPERRRLRLTAYADLAGCIAAVHVPAGSSRAGVGLHRELARAVALKVPVFILVARETRRRMNVEEPSAGRLGDLAAATGGRVVEEIDELLSRLASLSETVGVPA